MAATGTTVALNAQDPADRKAIKVWLAFLQAIGGRHGTVFHRLQATLSAESQRDATWAMPCRMPSELTGDSADDRRPFIDG